ncbi:MAG: glycoside hydrolase family 38 C-terminal domain-containing protein [Anaerolineae bacterium]
MNSSPSIRSWQVNLISHTHWDRAWYVTFQEYRIRLVQLIDRLLDILKKHPEYCYYMLDGQMSVLEDYLEVRPHKKAELQALTRSGRVQIGPWYVLADEFLVSPEALIRNLMLGHKIGEDYGGVMKIGYVPDGFGHIAQLPQILKGFGIDNVFFWRGMGTEGDELGTEFEWAALDGSSATTILMPWGYHTASNMGYGVHWGDFSQMAFDPELAQQKLDKFIAKLTPMAHTDAILLMNGIDHQEAQPQIPEIIAEANARKDFYIEQTTLKKHLDYVRAYAKKQDMRFPAFQGEFRWGRYSEILQGVHSTRLHLKQRNHQIETLFERVMEPLVAMAALAGATPTEQQEGTDDLVWSAWRWLLLNHPHDDMYGCGIDAVHEEMAYRFSQAEQIATFLSRDNLRALTRHVDFTGQGGIPVIFVNTLNWERSEITEVDIDFDYDDPVADNFELVTQDGFPVPHQILRDEQVFWMETLKANRKRRVRILIPVTVPGCGYTTLYVQPKRHPRIIADDWSVEAQGAENRYLRFVIEADGSLTVTHKATGKSYSNLNHFEDVADAGDAYTFCPVQGDIPISTAGNPAEIRQLWVGTNAVAYEIAHQLTIPKQISADRLSREGKTSITVISTITLKRDCPYIGVRTTFLNSAHDHKLSVIFPTDMTAQTAVVDESFAVVDRSIDLPASEGWVEDPTSLMHQRAFTDLSDGQSGLAIFNRGLASVEVTRTSSGTRIAIPLVRSVGWLSRDDLWVRRIAAGPLVPTPGAQCIGERTAEYAIFPHEGDWQAVYSEAYGYTTPITAARADTHAGIDLHDMNITRDDPSKITYIPFPRNGELPDTYSFVQVEGDGIVLSALRRAKNGDLLVRFFNVKRADTVAIISSQKSFRTANRLNLNEDVESALHVDDAHQLTIPVRAGEIVTLGLTFGA